MSIGSPDKAVPKPSVLMVSPVCHQEVGGSVIGDPGDKAFNDLVPECICTNWQ